jgi:photosystem II stability/assembly factor-like uncharacterized protein
MLRLRYAIVLVEFLLCGSHAASGPSTGPDLSRVFFADARNGFALGSGVESTKILKTSDGGREWKIVYQTTKVLLNGICFLGSEEGWAVGSGGTIIATSNGAQTWKLVESGTDQDLYSIAALQPSGPVFAVGKHGAFVRSDDKGKSWTKHTIPTTVDLTKVAVLPSGMLLVLGRDRLLTSRDSGVSWITHGPYEWDTLYSLSFVDEMEGFLSAGALLQTTDGGNTINPVILPEKKIVRQMCIADSQTIFVVAASLSTGSTIQLSGEKLPSDSTILKSIDLGKTWEPVFHLSDSETSKAFLADIFFLNSETGWAVGYGGTVASTIDGGKTWRVAHVRPKLGNSL